MEREYKKNLFVTAFQFDGSADNFIINEDVPKWAKEALKNGTIKKRDSQTLYIDHREHTDFIKNGDYIIRSELGKIFSMSKMDFDVMYQPKSEWISCGERLPNMDEVNKNDGRFILDDGNRRYQGMFDYAERKFVRFDFFCGMQEDKCVIAWQPLPKAYHE